MRAFNIFVLLLHGMVTFPRYYGNVMACTADCEWFRCQMNTIGVKAQRILEMMLINVSQKNDGHQSWTRRIHNACSVLGKLLKLNNFKKCNLNTHAKSEYLTTYLPATVPQASSQWFWEVVTCFFLLCSDKEVEHHSAK